MVRSRAIPFLVYGKQPDAGQIDRDPYRILYRSGDFPEHALEAFQRARQDFEWVPHPGVTHAPALAFVPLSERSGLALRFLDMGRDSAGRPHCMGIEAGLIETGGPLSPTAIVACLVAEAWPVEPLDRTTETFEFPRTHDSIPDAALADLLAVFRDRTGTFPSLIVGDEAEHTTSTLRSPAALRNTRSNNGSGISTTAPGTSARDSLMAHLRPPDEPIGSWRPRVADPCALILVVLVAYWRTCGARAPHSAPGAAANYEQACCDMARPCRTSSGCESAMPNCRTSNGKQPRTCK